MSIIGSVHEDVTTDVLGKVGRWQWLVTVVSAVFIAYNILNYCDDMQLLRAAAGATCLPPHQTQPTNYTLCHYYNGTADHKCTKWNIQLMGCVWIKRNWIVFCGERHQLLSVATVSRLGSAFGCVLFGFVADSFGRRTAMVIGIFGQLPLRLVITFCDSEGWFRLLVFLNSLFGGANAYMGLIVTCEIASNVWRTRLMAVAAAPRVIASVLMVPLANSLPNVETISFIACVYCVILIMLLRWMPKSPQWLLYNRQIHVAEQILYRAAKLNRVVLCKDFKIRPVNHRAYECLEEPMTCIAIWSKYNIRVTILAVLLLWSSFEFVWSSLYLIVYNEQVTNKLILSTWFLYTVFGCVTIFLSQKLKMRHILLLYLLTTCVITTGLILLKKGDAILVTVTSSLGLSCGMLGRFLILIITPRLFSVNLRAAVCGCCHAFGQIGSMVCYLMVTLKALDTVTFAVVIMTFSLTLSACCIILPDVDGRELPDVVEDMDYFMELSKPLRWVCQKSDSASHEEVEIKVHSYGSTASPDGIPDRPPPQNIGWKRVWRQIKNYFIAKLSHS